MGSELRLLSDVVTMCSSVVLSDVAHWFLAIQRIIYEVLSVCFGVVYYHLSARCHCWNESSRYCHDVRPSLSGQETEWAYSYSV